MKTDVENLSSTRVKIVVEIPFDELQDDLTAAYRSIGSQVNVPGFRKGKVPARIIDQRFGRGTVLSEVANAVIPRTYEQVMGERELVALGQPKVEVTRIEDGELIEFVAEVDVRPEFDLPDPAGITVEVEAVAVDDAAVDDEVLSLRKRFATYTDVERGAVDGDVVLVDVAAVDAQGEPVESFSAEGLSYEVGSETAFEGFDPALVGAQAGETRTLEHSPAEGDQAGAPLTLTITVKAVRERELPDADDEFAAMASEFDTMDELLVDLRERLERAGLFQMGSTARDKVRDAFLELVSIDLPEGLIADQLAAHFADGHGDENHRAETEAELRDTVKSQLVLDKLAEQHEVKVDQSELTQWLIGQASRSGMTPDQFANALVEGGQVESAFAEVRRAKALTLVVEAAKIIDTHGLPVDLDAIAEQLSGPSSREIDIEGLEEESDTGAEDEAPGAAEDAGAGLSEAPQA